MSDSEDRPEDTDGAAPPEPPSVGTPAWWLPPAPADETGTEAPERAAAAVEPPAPAPDPGAPDPVALDPGAPADVPSAADVTGGPDAPEQPVAPSWVAPSLPPAPVAPTGWAVEPVVPAEPVAPGWAAAPVAGAHVAPTEPVVPLEWAGAASGADTAGASEPATPAPVPVPVAGEIPAAPAHTGASESWSPAPVAGSAEDQGWPEPPPQAGLGGFSPSPVAPAGPPAGDHPPHGQSRNPVDRLTRGLPHPLRVTIDWIVTIVGAVAIVLLVKAFVVNPYRIPSSSMETTLHCAQPAVGCEARFSDRVLANRFLYRLRDPRRGEIIVFETPPAARMKCGAGGTFVKRLVGLPGETVEIRLRNGNGFVYVNGRLLKEPYIEKSRRSAVQSLGPVRIKPGNYFMMGDNRSQSCDSRMWGTVPRANLIGKVFSTYWPPNRVSLH